MLDAQGRCKVLLVDDSSEDREFFRCAIDEAELNAEICEADDGYGALKLLRSCRKPDVAVIDLKMPGLDGRGLLDALRGDPDLRGFPVIVLSSSDDPKEIAGCYDAGCYAYLQKPPTYGELVTLVDDLLDHCCWRSSRSG